MLICPTIITTERDGYIFTIITSERDDYIFTIITTERDGYIFAIITSERDGYINDASVIYRMMPSIAKPRQLAN